jgi:hypothetical protein
MSEMSDDKKGARTHKPARIFLAHEKGHRTMPHAKPRSANGWGGRRPGAGRKRRPRPPRLPAVGDVLLYWSAQLAHANDPARRHWRLVPLAALVVEPGLCPRGDEPAETVVRLAIFDRDGLMDCRDVIGSPTPAEGYWTWRKPGLDRQRPRFENGGDESRNQE